MPQDTLSAMLARNILFAELHEAELAELADNMRRDRFKARHTVFRQNDAGDRCYTVLSGVLRVTVLGEGGHETVLSILGAGDTFGEIALLDNQPRSATVVCHEPCELASIDRAAFVAFLDRHPPVRDRLIAALCRRIRVLTDRVEQLSSLDVSARLANTLLGLASAHGSELQGKRYLHVRMSQGELGSMVGASRESVNKLLRGWEESGLVAVVDGKLQLLDVAALERLGAAPV